MHRKGDWDEMGLCVRSIAAVSPDDRTRAKRTRKSQWNCSQQGRASFRSITTLENSGLLAFCLKHLPPRTWKGKKSGCNDYEYHSNHTLKRSLHNPSIRGGSGDRIERRLGRVDAGDGMRRRSHSPFIRTPQYGRRIFGLCHLSS